jgi:hypothetical protein
MMPIGHLVERFGASAPARQRPIIKPDLCDSVLSGWAQQDGQNAAMAPEFGASAIRTVRGYQGVHRYQDGTARICAPLLFNRPLHRQGGVPRVTIPC